MTTLDEVPKLPKSFILRRFHSLLGLWLVIYLLLHLLVNSQAGLFFQDQGSAFIDSVNRLESMPYLRVIELIFLGLPFLIHGIWGVIYASRAKFNDHKTDGSSPGLPQYKKNRAYRWERITAWLLIPAIFAHIVHMRFAAYPAGAIQEGGESYMVRLSYDKALPLVAEELHVELFTQNEILEKKRALAQDMDKLGQLKKEQKNTDALQTHDPFTHSEHLVLDKKEWLEAAEKKPLKKTQVLAVSQKPGPAFYLIVRDTFKSKLMVILYSLFVVAAAYHAFNGLWTFMITWGVALTRRAQQNMRKITNLLMLVATILGLIAIWGTYWTVQFQEPLSMNLSRYSKNIDF